MTGTVGLTALMLVALGLSVSRAAIARSALSGVRRLAAANLLVQIGHLAEELLGDFADRFPRMLGLAPWGDGFFIAFNGVWIAAWVVAIGLLGRFPRVGIFPLWFLALASLLNAVAHPLLAVAAGGFFPAFGHPLCSVHVARCC